MSEKGKVERLALVLLPELMQRRGEGGYTDEGAIYEAFRLAGEHYATSSEVTE